MPTAREIVTFTDDAPPPGASPYVEGYVPLPGIEVAEPDPGWGRDFDGIAARIREALGWRAIVIEHIGSTSVPGLPAKPVIDVDLVVADPDNESAYVPALEAAGFVLVIREPWWHGHRVVRGANPLSNVHVFGHDSPEVAKHRIFRDWLRGNPEERARYAQIKREAAEAANAAGEHVMEYNARKERVLRMIYRRAFEAAGLLDDAPTTARRTGGGADVGFRDAGGTAGGEPATTRIAAAELRRTCRAAILKAGGSAEMADALADATVGAEVRGHPAVGVSHLFDYLAALRSGAIDGTAEPRVEHGGARILVDAGGGIAHTAFLESEDSLKATAQTQGIALLTIRNAYTCGELGHFTGRLAGDGFVAIAAANSPALMALGPSGRPALGTNPLSLAAPVEGGPPLVIDQGASLAAYVQVRRAAEAGEPIPEGWAVDADGTPTTEAAAALHGALLPIAGHKGANLGLLVEVLAGLAGGNWGLDAPSFEAGVRSPGTGFLLIVIDPDGLDGGFAARLRTHLGRLVDDHGAHIPGRGRSPRDVIEIPDALHARLVGAGAD